MDSVPPKPNQTTDQPSKFSDGEAQSLLQINSLETKQKTRSSKKFLVVVIGLIILIIALALFFQARNHLAANKASNTTQTSNSANNPFTSGSGSVNSEVKYCSNPVNAQLTC